MHIRAFILCSEFTMLSRSSEFFQEWAIDAALFQKTQNLLLEHWQITDRSDSLYDPPGIACKLRHDAGSIGL